ncbi:MAG: hypothetical protein ACMXYE_04635 [Candidatus Woesearchaeota archaeon]
MVESIRMIVRDYVMQNPAVKECLSENLINTSALARRIIEKHQLNGSADAVISALRRLSNNGINSSLSVSQPVVSSVSFLNYVVIERGSPRENKVLDVQRSVKIGKKDIFETFEFNEHQISVFSERFNELLTIDDTKPCAHISISFGSVNKFPLLLQHIIDGASLAQVDILAVKAFKNELIMITTQETLDICIKEVTKILNKVTLNTV